MQFKKATKAQAKLRCATFGPAGSGKTFTALRIATGMGGTIGVIDTERCSASKYADRFDFSVLELEDRSIKAYSEAIQAAAAAKMDVLIIDSGSHAWQELLSEVDHLAKAKYRGNTWSAWSEGTPKQRTFIDAILNYPGHVIMTMRSKTEWTTEAGDNNKTRPVRVGLTPEQGKGIEYEFDLLLEMNPDHIGTVIKDRTGKFQDKMIEKPGEKFGQELIAWLNEGEPAQPKTETQAVTSTPNLQHREPKAKTDRHAKMVERCQALEKELEGLTNEATPANLMQKTLGLICTADALTEEELGRYGPALKAAIEAAQKSAAA